MALDTALAAADADRQAALDRLFAFLRIPSISTDPAYHQACLDAADLMVGELTALGFEASRRDTPGKPMVIGHHPGPAGAPHLLFYGHYDVQPVDPLTLWHRDPFDPALEETEEGPVIRARGASDDKGQVMTFIEAFRAWKAAGGLPVGVTVFLEGEEESGSPSLIPFLEANKDELKADLCMVCDTGLYDIDTPAITTMLRGLAAVEVTVTGPDRDLHSGAYGGPALNPIRALTAALGGLHDAEGRVCIPGFYDGVDPVPAEVRKGWDGLNFDAGGFLADVGLTTPAGEASASPLDQIWARPTAEINGIWGGYTGEGFKTVLPSKASAKVSFRLVGRQDPQKIVHAFEQFLRDRLPADAKLSFQANDGAGATVMPTDRPEFAAARTALGAEWPNPAVFVGSGGSIPIVGHFRQILGLDSILIGFGRENDNLHSPNEKYDLASFEKGIRAWIRVIDALG